MNKKSKYNINEKKVYKFLCKILFLTILLFISYSSIFLLSNLRVIVSKLSNSASISSFNFINIKMIIYSIVLFLSIYFKNKNNKKLYRFLTISILTIAFVEGVILNFNVLNYYLIYLYLLLISYFFMKKLRLNFSIALPIAVSVLLLSLFVISLLSILSFSIYFILLSTVIILIIIYKDSKKIDLINDVINFINIEVIIFSILFIIAILGGVGRYVHVWDEYSHWAYDAKAVIYYSQLSASQSIMSATRSYPPIISLWHYFINVFFNTFSETNLYIGLSIFISIYMMPAFTWIKNKKNAIPFLIVLSIYASPFLFQNVYSYDNLYADTAFAFVFSSTLLTYFKLKDDKNTNMYPLVVLLMVLSLVKPTGFIMSAVSLIIILLTEIFNITNKFTIRKLLNNLKLIIMKWWKYIFLSFSAIIIWYIYLYIMSKITTDFYDFVIISEGLQSAISYKLDKQFIIGFFNNIINSFDTNIFFGLINLSLFKFIILFLSAIIFIFYFESKNNLTIAIKKTIPFIIGYIFFFLLTVLSIFVMFTKYEASILASFGRYLGCFHLGIIVFILAYLSRNLINSKSKKILVPIVYLIIISSVPFKSIFYFATDFNEREKTNEINQNQTDRIYILKKYTEPNSLIYLIDQEDTNGIMAMWYSRYYAFPRKFNANSKAISWKIRTEKNKDDLQNWGLTAQDWEQNLIEYKFDYVFLYSSDDEFFNKISFMLNDLKTAKKYTLFKIKIEDKNKVKLIPVN